MDQFQGCYKDKYRCFAGYYMICRLVIITVLIVNSSNDFVANYMLTFVSVVTDLMHVIVKPYKNKFLNRFDGIILHLIILLTVLPLFSNDFNSPLAITLAYIFIFFPLLTFIAMALFLLRDSFKKLITHFTFKDKPLSVTNTVYNNDVPMREFDTVIDNSVRVNTTVCDM